MEDSPSQNKQQNSIIRIHGLMLCSFLSCSAISVYGIMLVQFIEWYYINSVTIALDSVTIACH